MPYDVYSWDLNTYFSCQDTKNNYSPDTYYCTNTYEEDMEEEEKDRKPKWKKEKKNKKNKNTYTNTNVLSLLPSYKNQASNTTNRAS